ncbi:hypothetical protein ILUMI_04548, partial [Ignelater luminosus]
FENQIISTLMQIKENINQHSVILSQLLTRAKGNSNDETPPDNVPKFPIKTLKEFEKFEDLLENDPSVRQYMIKRLAAIGGSGIAGLTRRIMKYLLNDDVCVLYSWKGRDKIPFEKTKTMDIVYQAAKAGFPEEGRNDLLIANPVKDWLKYARGRLNKQKIYTKQYRCDACNRSYSWQRGLVQHQRYECGKAPHFVCSEPGCLYKSKRKENLKHHILARHGRTTIW